MSLKKNLVLGEPAEGQRRFRFTFQHMSIYLNDPAGSIFPKPAPCGYDFISVLVLTDGDYLSALGIAEQTTRQAGACGSISCGALNHLVGGFEIAG
jgi:hypothetical protein